MAAAVIFDLDGTLVDSAGEIADALNAALAEIGLEPLSIAVVTSLIGRGVHVLVQRALAKIGAEGVHSVTVPEQGIGFAVKVEDGAQRAQFPAVLRILQLFDVLPAELPERLGEFLRRPVRNTRGETVGEVSLLS